MFVCVICSHKSRGKFNPCPRCKGRETCAPEVMPRRRRLSDVEASPLERFDCGEDWNTALGGGIVRGGIVLVASRGGSGKTTEMLRVAARLGTEENPSIYAFTERTEGELSAHAAFIGIDQADRAKIAAVAVTSIAEAVEATPSGAHLFLDSWGNLERPDPADVARIREIEPASAWLICHVNKRGEIEGRQKLDHAASAVVWVRKTTLRTSKNWHGPQRVTDRILPATFAGTPSSGTTRPGPRKLRAVN